MRRLSMIGAWFIVLVVTTSVTWSIVSAADEQVSSRPVSPLNVEAPLALSESSTTNPASTSSTSTTLMAITTTTPSESGASTTATTAPPTTTTAPPPSPPTTVPAPTSTTTSIEQSWATRSIPTQGGTVVVRYRPEEVVLQTATPAPGFQVDIEKSGPPSVKVEFESEDAEVEVTAEWSDGELDVEVSGPD